MNQTLKVLFVISEADPLIKIGGLGDVGGTLPIALNELTTDQTGGITIDVRVVIPYHDEIKQKGVPTNWVVNYKIPYEGHFQDVYVSQAVNTRIPIYLIDGDPIRNKGIYNSDTLADAYKYTFFSVSALELCHAIDWHPDILHAHDWHTAISVQKLSQIRPYDSVFHQTHSLFTIHNLPYSGGDHPEVLSKYDVNISYEPDIPGFYRSLPMALGLSSADMISTVSETYAKEIMTKDFGNGYEEFLRNHANKICGIVNGIMMDQWNPQTDHVLYKNFSSRTLTNRIENKRMLQQEVNLPQRDEVPLFVMIGRLTYQKGIDLCLQSLRQMRYLDWQLILLGTGDPDIQMKCQLLASEFPDRVRAEIRYDGLLSRKMYAGGDMLLMPSRYEPCGIAQMIAMLYGCIPVAHATGGLRDTIIAPLESKRYTGFLFENADIGAAEWAMRQALKFFEDKDSWIKMQRRCMGQDFSWKKSALKYLAVYKSLCRI